MTEIYLMRHAESTMQVHYSTTVGGRQNEIELTPHGVQQAERARDFLLRHSIHPTIKVASLAVRALRTTSIALDTPIEAIRQDWHFQEQTHGDAEGKLRTEVYTDAMLHQLSIEGMNFALPGGESTNQVADRMHEGILQEAQAAGEHDVVFIGAHGVAIKSLIARLGGYDQMWIYRTLSPNCCLTRLLYENDRLELDHTMLLVDTQNG